MTNFITRSLRAKFILLFLCISLIPMAIIGYVGYASGKKTIQKQLFESFTAIAEGRENEILTHLTRRIEQIEILAANKFVQDHIVELNKKERGEVVDVEALAREADIFVKIELPELEEITTFYEYIFIGETGKVYFSTDESLVGKDFSQDARFREGLKERFYIDVFFDKKKGGPAYGVVVPIFLHEVSHLKPIGVIIAFMGTVKLNKITTNREGLGETGEVYIVNKDGYMITESRFLKDVILKQMVDTDPVRLFKAEKKIMTGVYPDYRGIPVLGASMGDDIDEKFGLGWTILAEIDESEALKSIRNFGYVVLVILVMTIGLVILTALILSHQIANPIRKLTGITKIIAGGDLSKRAEIKSKDEIGILASSFNKMSANLQDSQEKIQTQNEELNASNEELKSANEKIATTNEELASTNEELKQTNEELEATTEELRTANEEAQKAKEVAEKKAAEVERFNKMAVGRELKMRELKERIAELEAKLSGKS